jgi:hypothetical protein
MHNACSRDMIARTPDVAWRVGIHTGLAPLLTAVCITQPSLPLLCTNCEILYSPTPRQPSQVPVVVLHPTLGFARDKKYGSEHRAVVAATFWREGR